MIDLKRPVRLLYVDDDRALSRLVQKELGRHGYDVVCAGDGDEGLRLMAESWVPACCLVGKTWKLHLEKVTKVDPDENLAMIADSVGFLAQQGKRVVYDCEHFFDAYRDDPDYALQCVRVAADAGAEVDC